MAKKKKKAKQDRKDRKKQRRIVGGNALLGTFAGGVVGKVVERLIVNEIEGFLRPHLRRAGKAEAGKNGEDDIAGRLLAVLADGGCKDIPRLLAETHVGLSKLLHALQTLRDFRLVNFVGEPGEEVIEVTRSGAHTATSLRRNHIHDEAARLLAS